MLKEKFVINLGFQPTNLVDFKLGAFQIAVFNEAKEHESEDGNIISGIFRHKENENLVLAIYSEVGRMFTKTYIAIGIFNGNRKGIDHCFSTSIGNGFSEDHDFVEETLKNYVAKYLKG